MRRCCSSRSRVTVLTVVLFGVGPAVRGARIDLHEVVRDGWRATRSAAGRRLADAFVVGQFALSVMLLVVAALLLRSLGELLSVDPGFRPDGVLVGRVSMPWLDVPEARNRARALAFYSQLDARIAALPGVRRAGLSSAAPFSDGEMAQVFAIKGREPGPDEPKLVASVRAVTPGYFDAIGTTLRRGRLIEPADRPDTPLVVVVDETLARRFWPDGNAVGQLLRLGDKGPWRTIVGVVGSVKHYDLAADARRFVYVPFAQRLPLEMDLVVQTTVDPASLTSALRHEIHALDPSLPFYDVHTLDDAVERSVDTRRLTNRLLAWFSIAAIALASLGIYGVTALGVGQRVQEFGVRLALGAPRAACTPPRAAARADARHRGTRNRTRRRGMAHALREHAAVPRGAARSGDLRGGGAGARRRRPHRVLHPGAARDTHRSAAWRCDRRSGSRELPGGSVV